jgi:outer membrane protein assembly factor BamB
MRQPKNLILLIGVALALAACGDSDNKIGTTVKGTRIAVLQKAKTVVADTNLHEQKPELPEITDNPNWPQAGYEPDHVMPNSSLRDVPQEVWSAGIGEGSDSDFKLLSRPVINNGVVFTLDSQGLVNAFESQSGDNLWEFDTTPIDNDNKAISGGIGADGDRIYVTTGFGEVIALSARDGHVIWRRSLQNPLRAAPTIADGKVYAVSIDNQLSALNADTGEILWHHNGIIESATLMGASNPAVVSDGVIVAYSSGELYDLRAENGRVSWNYVLATPTQVGALPAIADIRGLPIVDHGHVFAISHSGRMASIDLRTGDRDWEIDVGGVNSPAVGSDTLFVLSNDGQLIAVNRDNGRILWVHEMQHLVDPTDHDSDPVFWTGPVLGGNKLWMTNSLGQLVSFSVDDGSQLSAIDVGEPSFVPPVIAGGIVYVVLDDGHIVALR